MRSALRLVGAFLALATPTYAQIDEESIEQARQEMNAASGAEVRMTRSPATGLATFVAPERGRSIPVAGRNAEERARHFMRNFGPAFGLPRHDDTALATVRVHDADVVGMDHVRFQQVHLGVPVTGAEMIVHLRGAGVTSVNGRTVSDLASVDMSASLGADRALERARRAVGRAVKGATVSLSEPRLELLNRGLLEGRAGSSRLAWFVEASGFAAREYVWIDARTGQTLLRFSQLTEKKKRTIYDGQSLAKLPGQKIRKEGEAPIGDADADLAYDYLGDTYDYFYEYFGRDSYNDKGAELKATVHHCPSPDDCPYLNAYWDGKQMVFGEDFSAADDVVAHELTHAVTEYTANLFYYMQSGALNESFSDIFGEAIDLINGSGTDTGGVRWLLGEDVPFFGAIRNLSNPGAFGDPGKMSDAKACDQAPAYEDGGGVHQNSGIPNHAFALMVDGGTFNSISVTGIGLDKAGQVQYRTLSRYLTSASDFLDAYNAHLASCDDLIGSFGITAGDCVQVQKALDAVEMSNDYSCSPVQPDAAPFCGAGQAPQNLFFDDMEKDSSKWKIGGLKKVDGVTIWNTKKSPLGSFATSGENSFWGYDPYIAGVATIEMKKGVTLPENAFLRFNHSFGFDNWAGIAYDGGLLVFTPDGSGYFHVPGSLPVDGATYNATLSGCCGNPNGGQPAFGYASWGFTSTRVDLSDLAGFKPQFGFWIASDTSVDDYGWFIDDFQIYTCEAAPTVSIADVTKKEGKKPGEFKFDVTLSFASGAPVTVRYRTADGTADAGDDYEAATGILTFAPGVKRRSLDVIVLGEKGGVEPHETFHVGLEDIMGATPGDVDAIGTILNDD